MQPAESSPASQDNSGKVMLTHLPGNSLKVTLLATCVSCVLRIADFCIMGNWEKSTFCFFWLPDSMRDIKSAMLSYKKEIFITASLFSLKSLILLKI